MLTSLYLPPSHLRLAIYLHHLEGGRVDDGGIALLHEAARDLPHVLHHLLRKEVRCKGLSSICGRMFLRVDRLKSNTKSRKNTVLSHYTSFGEKKANKYPPA